MIAIIIFLILGIVFLLLGFKTDRKRWKDGYTEDSIHTLFYIIGISIVFISIVCMLYEFFIESRC